MTKGKVYIRVDGSAEIGLGHVIRCLALAEMIKSDFVVHFVCKEIPVAVENQVTECGILLTRIELEQDFFNLLSGDDIVVLDHYNFGCDYHKQVKALGIKLVCIDDLHDKAFYADLVINHSPGLVPQNYNALPYTQFALGLDYALLRPPFLTQAKQMRKIDRIKSVFICFGGSDPKNLTAQVLKVVLDYQSFAQIIVVTGAGYAELDSLTPIVANVAWVRHYHAVTESEMLKLMLEAELVIVPASGILLEALAVKSCVISGSYVENQKRLFKNFKDIKAFVSAEDFSNSYLKSALNEVLQRTEFASILIDGRSPERILKLFGQLKTEKQVTLRRAQMSDLAITYSWATDKAIRSFSFGGDDIKPDEHERWFESRLESNTCVYYMAEINSQAVGSIRFDIEDQEAVISYLIDSHYHNKGLGVILLRAGIAALIDENLANLRCISGLVMPANRASCKVFEKLGFTVTNKGKNFKYTYLIETIHAN